MKAGRFVARCLTIVSIATAAASAQQPAPFPPAQSSAPAPQFDVRLGVQIRPDTVTVGQRFIVVLRIVAPAGSIVRFPESLDSAAAASTLAPRLSGPPAIDSAIVGGSLTRSAAYAFTAWDVGSQPLGLAPIAVEYKGSVGYVSLAARHVIVRSVLPADTTLWKPKPARQPLPLPSIDWRPLIAVLAAIIAALLLWWAWRAWKRRRNRPLPPFEAAERDFARIEAMALIAAGRPEQHVAMMTDVARAYLAARVDGVHRSQTTSELLRAAASIRGVAPGLEDLLTRADMVKFARGRVTTDEATTLGVRARSVVRSVEDHLAAREQETQEKKAA